MLANSNEASPGDPILQPGPYDGGKYPDDHIANLEEFVPISFDEQASDCSLTVAWPLSSTASLEYLEARTV